MGKKPFNLICILQIERFQVILYFNNSEEKAPREL
jgi:hypothetical protein